MTRKEPVNVGASVRARLLRVSKERQEDFTLTLMNYGAERFLYRLANSAHRDRFVLKGAMLFAVRLGERYRPTRDLDLLGLGEPSEAAIASAVREIATTNVEDDGLVFDVDSLQVQAIREDNAHGGIRAVMQARLVEARIHIQIDVGFGDAVTPGATSLQFPTLLAGMPAPNVLAYPTETIIAEKVEAMVDLGLSNSRMKDFTDVAVAARRAPFDGVMLVAAIRATFGRRGTQLPSVFVDIRLTASRAHRNAPMTFVANTRGSRPASMDATRICVSRIPALFTRAVSRPSSRSHVSKRRSTSASSATSAATAVARAPRSSMLRTTSSAAARFCR